MIKSCAVLDVLNRMLGDIGQMWNGIKEKYWMNVSSGSVRSLQFSRHILGVLRLKSSYFMNMTSFSKWKFAFYRKKHMMRSTEQ